MALLYKPVKGFTGKDRFSYTINDNYGRKDLAAVESNIVARADSN